MGVPEGAVVVGVDSGPVSLEAVDWAVQEAVHRAAPLYLLHATGADAGPWALPASPSGMRARGRTLLRRAVGRVGAARREVPVPVDVDVDDRPPGPALRAASARACLVVVGAVGHGWVHDMTVGSVSLDLCYRADSDVVVVRRQEDPGARRVVVGVDGSDGGDRALVFAAGIATRRSAPLTVLHCWTAHRPSDLAVAAVDVGTGAESHERLLRAVVDRCVPPSAVQPDRQLAAVRPGSALVEASRHAALLVVGARGTGGVAGLHLGSVVRSVLHDARCTVAVVRR
ncbi:universal stress protein [Pseudonocardia alni]|uniref:universal stress protein n=1 Tax=Pseudonocardia alni TaxID=33907 RepID=UPI0033233A56